MSWDNRTNGGRHLDWITGIIVCMAGFLFMAMTLFFLRLAWVIIT